MSIVVGTNSWVTLVEANAYFATKYNAAATWATLTDAVKEQLLISAYYWIQQQKGFSIAPTSTAAKVKQAQYESAWFIYKFGDNYDKRRALQDQGVKSFSISKFSETFTDARFPSFIADMLEDFAAGSGGKFPFVSRSFDA